MSVRTILIPFAGFFNQFEMKTPSWRIVLSGALAGALLTAALIGVLFAGWRLADLPFVPFDLFDWTARVLPGALIEFVISAMVAVIRGLHLGDTSVVAKMIEQALGVAGLFLLGIASGAILSLLRGTYGMVPGLLFGLVVGIGSSLVSTLAGRTAAVPPLVGILWVLCVFVTWGILLSWTGQRIAYPEAEVPARAGQAKRINRRQFMIRLAGYTAVITVSGAVVGMLSERHSRMRLAGSRTWSSSHELPNAAAAVKPAPGTRPEFTPLERHYRIDIHTVPPVIDGRTWRLDIAGQVENPLSLTLDQIRGYEPVHQFITLSCISNPVGGDLIGTTRWTGVSLKQLLPVFRLKPGATHLKITSADGFWETVAVDTINADERVMLVYAWDGLPLLPEHGFPLRIYIPDVHGMKQPKWIRSIEAVSQWEPGYWVVRGWDRVARMKTTSVIDAVAVDMNIIKAGPDMRVPIGGIAHAGARGISRVDVKVDDGPWQQAKLRSPLSGLTWVVWRYDWPFQPGKHTFTVRAFDGTGAPQITEQRPPAPNGA